MLTNLIRILLFPPSILWGIITGFRNFLYHKGFLKGEKGKINTLVIGNLSFGGTGKTPTALYLFKHLGQHFPIAILSRGYGRKSKGFFHVNKQISTRICGDEPCMMALNKAKPSVFVCENRLEGIKAIDQHGHYQLVVLDDAFQHRKLKGNFNLLLSRYDKVFFDDHLAPMGYLRESRHSAKRAQGIIITNCPENMDANQKKIYQNKIAKYSDAPVFFAYLNYAKPQSYLNNKELVIERDMDVLLFTGIAQPNQLIAKIKGQCKNIHVVKGRDHQKYGRKEIKKVQKIFDNIANAKKIMLTTEKDMVKLKEIEPLADVLQVAFLYFQPVEMEIFEQKEKLLTLIYKYVE